MTISDELTEIRYRLEDISLPNSIDVIISEPGEEILFFSQTILNTTIDSLGILRRNIILKI